MSTGAAESPTSRSAEPSGSLPHRRTEVGTGGHMGFAIQQLDNGRGVRRSFWGVLSGAELIASLEESLQSEATLRGYRYSLLDFSAIVDLDLSQDDLLTLAGLTSRISALNPDILVAIIAPQDIIFGLARMWEAYADESCCEMHIARSPTEAEGWLRERGRQKFGQAPPIKQNSAAATADASHNEKAFDKENRR